VTGTWREFDEKGGPPQLIASVAAERATAPRHTLLAIRCDLCGAEVGGVRRSPRGLLFRGVIHTPPKELGLLKSKEKGKQANERWLKGVTGLVVDLLDLDLGPHPQLKVRGRCHGEGVVHPDDLRKAIAARKKVLPIHLSAVPMS
jgi:hypothetical protein